jgi:pentatricopeptide repeat protein
MDFGSEGDGLLSLAGTLESEEIEPEKKVEDIFSGYNSFAALKRLKAFSYRAKEKSQTPFLDIGEDSNGARETSTIASLQSGLVPASDATALLEKEEISKEANFLISYYLLKKNRLDLALKALQIMESSDLQVDEVTYHGIIEVALKENNLQKANEILAKVINDPNVIPSSAIWHCKVTILAKEKKYEDAKKLLSYLAKLKVPMKVQSYNVVLEAMVQQKSISAEEVKDFWIFMHEVPGLQLNTDSFNLMVQHCYHQGEVERAFFLYDELNSVGLKPDENTFASLLRAASRAPHWVNGYQDTISDALYAIEAKQMIPTRRIYNEVIRACGEFGDSVAAEYYFWEMKRKGLTPDQVTYRNLFISYARANSLGGSKYSFHPRYVRKPEKPKGELDEAERLIGPAAKFKLESEGFDARVEIVKGKRLKIRETYDLHATEGTRVQVNQDILAKAEKIKVRSLAQQYIGLTEGKRLDLFLKETGGKDIDVNDEDAAFFPDEDQRNDSDEDEDEDDDDIINDKYLELTQKTLKNLLQTNELEDGKRKSKGRSTKLFSGRILDDELDEEEEPSLLMEKEEKSVLIPEEHQKNLKAIPKLLKSVQHKELYQFSNATKKLEAIDHNLQVMEERVLDIKKKLYLEDPFVVKERLLCLPAEERKEYTYKILLQKLRPPKALTVDDKPIDPLAFSESAFLHCPDIKGLRCGAKNLQLKELGLSLPPGGLDVLPIREQQKFLQDLENKLNSLDEEDDALKVLSSGSLKQTRASEQLNAIDLLDGSVKPDARSNSLLTNRQQRQELSDTITEALRRDAYDKADFMQFGRPPQPNYHVPLSVTRKINKHRALAAWNHMVKVDGVQPNVRLYNDFISVFMESCDLSRTAEIFKVMKEDKVPMLPLTYESMMRMFLRSKDFAGTVVTFENMKKDKAYNPECFGLMVESYTHRNMIVEALQVLEEAKELNMRIPERNLTILRNTCRNLGVAHPDMPPDPKQWVKDLKVTQRRKKFAGKRRIQSVSTLSYI